MRLEIQLWFEHDVPIKQAFSRTDNVNFSYKDRMISSIDDTVFAGDTKTTALEREKTKVIVLNRQLEKTLDEKKNLQNELRRTQQQLENQIKQTLHLRKQQQCQKKLEKEQSTHDVDPKDEEIKDLKEELKTTQADLAKEISSSKQREVRLLRAVEQCSEYEKELRELRQLKDQENGNSLLVKQLERQRDELLNVVKYQIKLMNILKQQALHAKAAAILEIVEKDVMKELSSN